MKFSVAAPLVALLPAFILALLTLLAGITPKFMPDAYIVRIVSVPEPPSDEPGSNFTNPPRPGKGNHTALIPTPSSSPGLNFTDPRRPGKGNHTSLIPTASTSPGQSKSSEGRSSSTSFVPKWTPTTSISASTSMSASPPHTPPKIHPPLESGLGCTLVTHRGCLNKTKNAQGNLPIKKLVSLAGNRHHVPIHARSTPGNHTSTPSKDTSDTDEWEAGFPSYSLHFLTNCQWSVNNKTERCTKPWDFVGYSLESDLLEEDNEGDDDENNNSRKDDQPSRSFSLFSKRKAVNDPKSDDQPDDDEDDDDKYEKNARKLIDNRDAFSKVHLTVCVFVGLSFLCTAISFFILPALGQWISVGNLALATLATIFLFTSSIFTAVMVKGIHKFLVDEGFDDVADEPGKTFGALV